VSAGAGCRANASFPSETKPKDQRRRCATIQSRLRFPEDKDVREFQRRDDIDQANNPISEFSTDFEDARAVGEVGSRLFQKNAKGKMWQENVHGLLGSRSKDILEFTKLSGTARRGAGIPERGGA
jgi:hypothetical protein